MFSHLHTSTDTDVVSLSALHLAVTVGSDHWRRTRPQPVTISIYLHLAPSYLNTPGLSDNVVDSLHYGHLAKAVEKRVGEKGERCYASARALADDVIDAAFDFAMDGGNGGADGIVRAVRVVLEFPKQILLAGSFEVELTTQALDWISGATGAGAIVHVKDLTLPVLIGVNPPERLSKQRVVTNITFFEASKTGVDTEVATEVDYLTIVQHITSDIEGSAHLTLEKFVYEVIKAAYHASDPGSDSSGPPFNAITVLSQKPSALSFADASGVEMTRTLDSFRRM